MPQRLKLVGDNPRYERWRWQVFAVTWLAYAGFYLTRKSFSVAKIPLAQDPAVLLSESAMAWIDGVYLTSYTLGQFLWGVFGDRYGTRKVILAGMLMSSVASFLMGASSLAIWFGVFFLIQGLCQSTGWAPLSKNISCFFSRPERGSIMGLWCTNYAVGGFVASLVAGYCGTVYGWRWAFYAPALGLLLIWVLFFAFQRNRPEDVGLEPIEQYHRQPQPVLSPREQAAEQTEGSWKTILAVLTNPIVVLLAVVYLFLKPTRYAILFWGPMYLHQKLGTDMLRSGAISALFELAGPASVLLGGIASDRLFASKRMPVSILCMLALAVMLLVMDWLPASQFILGTWLFLLGFLLFAPDSLISGTAAIDFGTKKGASTAAGLINGAGSAGAIVGGMIPGFLHDHWGWHGVFLFLSLSCLVAGCLLLPKWNVLPAEARQPKS